MAALSVLVAPHIRSLCQPALPEAFAGLRPRARATGPCQLRASSIAAEGDMAAWPARKLRSFLDERGVRHADCFEKRELVDRARAAASTPPRPPAQPSTPPPRTAPRAASSSSQQSFTDYGELVTVPAQERERASFLFLHGFGDSARGFAGQLPNLLRLPEVRYLLPTAPSAGGMNSWFSFAGGAAGGARRSVEYTHHLIRQELQRGVPGKKIFVGGFSQGGSVAVKAALSFPDAALGGCVAASTFLNMGGGSSDLDVAAVNSRTPLLCVHGEADPVVPLSSGQNLVAAVRSKGVPAELRTYPGMAHAYCPEEAADVANFIRKRLQIPSDDSELLELSARELKAILVEAGASTVGCFEKADLLERARQVFV